ncbi:M24 family metallopeptidase [Providencia vermicola]|uniref:M24 family metallopeptidase n=1 Tax=Providencia vermicola TaxID=333965 RepID=A0AAX3S6U5_9GAMM|nr:MULTISPECIES: M24 family metallopeptidase [Providencia]ELX8379640.1 M24 family metallopeptidase [Providencia stuartii]EMD5258844.1 M24 family metallopeptidase [Providencia stuartii]USB35768.1 M24 family metallopeptidase [Providencia vermicola]WFC08275.1 M24 family metallopeptidase [Providencia vermicola]
MTFHKDVSSLKQQHLENVTNNTRKIMEREGIEALVATVSDNFYHLTGFASFFMYTFRQTGSAIAVIFRDPSIKSLVIMNEFEAANLQLEMPNAQMHTFPIWVDVDDPYNPDNGKVIKQRPINSPIETIFTLLKDALAEAGVYGKPVAIELNQITHMGKVWLDKVIPGLNLVDSAPLFNELRVIKSEWEISHLRKSAQITEAGIQAASELIKVGCTSAELTAAFKAKVMEFPETNYSRFNLISVGSDFSPKMLPENIPAKEGDLIKFDCGVDVAGYGADIARTFVVGQANEKVQEIYQTIHKGHEYMLSRVAPGVRLSDVFNETMALIRCSGLPHYNRGHLGHGDGVFVGLEEAPFVSAATTDVFQSGMVMSLETPYYGIGIGGIMIEDMLLITDDGVEMFSHLSRDLISRG